jgi:hypothetical protein
LIFLLCIGILLVGYPSFPFNEGLSVAAEH